MLIKRWFVFYNAVWQTELDQPCVITNWSDHSMSVPFKNNQGWFVYNYSDKLIGPFKSENDAFLATSLGESVEDLTLSMIEQGLITDDYGKVLTPKDFSNWPKTRKR